MRVVLGLVALLGGCSFTAHTPTDASDDAAPDSVDAFGGRVKAGLIGLWTFDEGSGTALDDTSTRTPAVPLAAGAPVMWNGDGTMTTMPGPPMVIASAMANPNPARRLSEECVLAQGVTLEVWVSPSMATQGNPMAVPPDLRVVAGISTSINSRNVSILQAGDRWLGRVRTGADANGGPDLLPEMSTHVTGTMTHLVLTADATTRRLYINGDMVAETTPAAAPLGWDAGYRMVLGNEVSLNRTWLGTYALVALYNRALPDDQVKINFRVGPEAPAAP